MKRLQTKCIIASAGFHLLLALILLVGPAFVNTKPKQTQQPPMTLISSVLLDDVLSHGGVAGTRPPPPAPVQQPAQPQPRPVVNPPPPPVQHEQVKEAVRDPDPPKPTRVADPPPSKESDSFEVKEKPSRRPKISLEEVTRRPEKSKSGKKGAESSDREAQREAQREARRRTAIASQLASAARSLDDLSTAPIDANPGVGGGGPAVGNYDQVIQEIYLNAWLAPEGTAFDDAITKATVTIASDGTVLSARILRAAGDVRVDGSVRRALDNVTTVPPFPAGAREKERTYIINFNTKAKRLRG